MLQTSTEWTLDRVYEELKKDNVQINTKFPYSHQTKTNNKTINMSLGRIWWNCNLPQDFELIDEKVDSKELANITSKISKSYPPDQASDIMSDIQVESFKLATIIPSSFKIEAFTPPEKWITKRTKFQKEIPTLSEQDMKKQANELTDELLEYMDKEKVGIQDAISAGISGKVSKDTWQMLMISRGNSVDINGKISRIPEATGEGYSIENYYNAAAQARATFYLKSTAVSEPGLLA